MNKQFSTNFEKYDYMTQYEELIGNHLTFLKYDVTSIIPETLEETIFYLLTIMTILYKEYIYNKYYEQVLIKIVKINLNTETLMEIIKNLNIYIKNQDLKKAYEFIKDNNQEISQYVERYYSRRDLNYILERKPIELMSYASKYVLKLNPYLINQCIKQINTSLTEDEKTISDVIDYSSIASRILINNDYSSVFSLTKNLMIRNYQIERLRKSILFIICDVYQETMLNEKDPNYEPIKEMMEKKEIYSNERLLEKFILDDGFSTVLLSSFLDYNRYIKEGRLSSLKQKPSYEYVKKRINK